MTRTQDVDSFFSVLQEQYGEAFRSQDSQGLFDTSYALTRAYAALGNLALAGRWAHECEKHTDDPNKVLALNMVLICGIIKQRYLNHG
jgi:hypothetical protein